MWISTFGGGLHLGVRKDNRLSFVADQIANDQQNMMLS
jgi:hypothetical protein